MNACGHTEAVYRCTSCSQRIRATGPFPLQVSRDAKTKSGPVTIPWEVADKAWAEYARQYGTQQSVERLAQRGGFSWGEMDFFYPPWREEADEVQVLRARVKELEAHVKQVERAADASNVEVERLMQALDETRTLHDDALRQASEHALARTKAEAEVERLRKELAERLTRCGGFNRCEWVDNVCERCGGTLAEFQAAEAALAGKGARRE